MVEWEVSFPLGWSGGLGLEAEQSCLGKGYDTSAGGQFLCKAPGRPPGEGILCVDFTT